MQGTLLHSYGFAYVKLKSMMQIYLYEMPTNLLASNETSVSKWKRQPNSKLDEMFFILFFFLHFPCVCCSMKDNASFFAWVLENLYNLWTWRIIFSILTKYIFWFSQFWQNWEWWFEISLFSLQIWWVVAIANDDNVVPQVYFKFIETKFGRVDDTDNNDLRFKIW